jgi:hypothetical protein
MREKATENNITEYDIDEEIAKERTNKWYSLLTPMFLYLDLFLQTITRGVFWIIF